MLEGGVTCREQPVCPPHLLYGEVVVILAEMLAVETVVRVCFAASTIQAQLVAAWFSGKSQKACSLWISWILRRTSSAEYKLIVFGPSPAYQNRLIPSVCPCWRAHDIASV